MCETDIAEDEIHKLSPQLLQILLKDHSVSHHLGIETPIFWATHDYEPLGEGYCYLDHITPEKITGKHGRVIRPRARKSVDEQQRRVTSKAEVFTPVWICNKQNNLIDNAWFGRENVFNTEIDTPDGNHIWQTTDSPITFPEGKQWRDYVRAPRLEVACGEAPYLASRYDTTTCDTLIPVHHRIGILDRKLRIVGENTTTSEEWLMEAFNALHNTYGFEWQGDNLLLAREALLYTFKEHFEAKFGETLSAKILENAAYIISWNVWQMDGLKCVVPDSCQWAAPEDPKNVIDEDGNYRTIRVKRECLACKKGNQIGHIGVKCIVPKWRNVTDKEPSRACRIREYYRYPNLQIPIREEHGEELV